MTDDDPGQKPDPDRQDDPALWWAAGRAKWAADLYRQMLPTFTTAQNIFNGLVQNQVKIANSYEGIWKALQGVNQANMAALQAQAEVTSKLMTSVVAGLPDLSELADLAERLRREAYPPNWPLSLTRAEILTAVAIVRDEGIPLAWVPRPDLVIALIAAPDLAARDSILVARQADILEDCQQALGEVVSADLKPLADFARDAVRTLDGGMTAGAQALAANVFDTLLRQVFRRGNIFGVPQGKFKYDKITGAIAPLDHTTTLADYRVACVLSPVLPALDLFDLATDPVPARFGRHPTAHCTHATQYTSSNAIIAVMLLISMLREAEESGW